ncbi:MAG: hypothetical protein N2053_09330 [Chitinispirillaceae bacterium]|nr:hypothetical protein [Chitinispirillaceae bacterium]
MIRINLLKRFSKETVKKRKGTSFLPKIAVAFSFILLLFAGYKVFVIIKPQIQIPSKKMLTNVKKEDITQKTTTSFLPSTSKKKSNIVEEVVREITEERGISGQNRNRGEIDLPYEELSLLEKINFEVLFGKRMFEIVSRSIPLGIGLKTLEITNFQSMYAVGLAKTKEEVSSVFITLRSEKLELLPQPHSYITSNNGEGYRFVVTCKSRFGLDLSDPFMATDNLPARSDINIILAKVKNIADSIKIGLKRDILSMGGEKVGIYRRFTYQFKCVTSYSKFVGFIVELYNRRVPIAFKSIKMEALNDSAIDIRSEFLLTTKE